jgi:hypothetical protein
VSLNDGLVQRSLRTHIGKCRLPTACGCTKLEGWPQNLSAATSSRLRCRSKELSATGYQPSSQSSVTDAPTDSNLGPLRHLIGDTFSLRRAARVGEAPGAAGEGEGG